MRSRERGRCRIVQQTSDCRSTIGRNPGAATFANLRRETEPLPPKWMRALSHSSYIARMRFQQSPLGLHSISAVCGLLSSTVVALVCACLTGAVAISAVAGPPDLSLDQNATIVVPPSVLLEGDPFRQLDEVLPTANDFRSASG
ncbi:MAG: hypothetical protein RIR10_1673, partial [Planctomycetota bacterium]